MKNQLVLFMVFVIVLIGCKQIPEKIHDSKTSVLIRSEITDKFLIQSLDTYIKSVPVDSIGNMIRVVTLNIPYEKSVIIVNMPSYYLRSKYATAFNYKYRGYPISIYSGIDEYDLIVIPTSERCLDIDSLERFQSRLYNYISMKFEHNLITEKDTAFIMESNPFLIRYDKQTDLKFHQRINER